MKIEETSVHNIEQPKVISSVTEGNELLDSLNPEELAPLTVLRENYPRIARAVEMMWGTADMDDYFRALVIDDRRDRSGFPQEILTVILKLSVSHSTRFKFETPEAGNGVWSDPFYRHAFR